MRINRYQLANTTGTTARDKIAATANFLTQGVSNTVTTSYATASVSPADNALVLIVVAHVGGSAAEPTGISGAGLTFTKLVSGPMEATWGSSSLWYACDAAPGTGAITITFAANHDGCRWSMAEFTCAADPADNGKGAILQIGVEAFNGITPLTTHIANKSEALDNEHAIVLINCRNQAAAVTQTPGTGLTELSDTSGTLSADGRFFHMAWNWSAIELDDARFTNNNSGTYGGSYFLELKTLPSGPVAYTLVAAPGSYAVAGQTAGLKWAHKLAAGVGAYTYAGSAAGLKRGYKVGAAVGTYSVSGQVATLRAIRKLIAAAGSYAVAGTAAALKKGYTLTGGVGAYTYTGATAALKKTWKAVATTGTYSISGTAAVLRANRKITAAVGSYAVAGSAANLIYSPSAKVLVAAAGAYTVTGTAAALRKISKTVAASGTYTFTYQPAGLKFNRKLGAGLGTYAVAGQTAVLRKAHRLVAGVGVYGVAGTAAGLKYGRKLGAGIGTYAVTGQAAALRNGHKLVGAAGSYAVAGQAATFRRGYGLVSVAGSYSWNGQNANLKLGTKVPAGIGTYSYTGFDAQLLRTFRVHDVVMVAVPGEYKLEATETDLISTTVVYNKYNRIFYNRTRRLGTG